ncbi:hypothetical protein [Jannaschia formosa]|uniref:hypothetical protein n=1 Tax=Jannaschia formosa TaxID=2259592 RepID=UPI000E1BF04C|nr:hypothetical protein [Jannaschia formosa]TFL17307.1 hypothetical protein DR046_15030 [Jannaschia formosa]
MKTVIASALIALAAAAPVAAQQVAPGAAAAIAHFNQSADAQGDRITHVSGEASGASVSTRSGALGAAFDRFNADADNRNDLRGLQGATVVSGAPATAADIHARIRAESRETE